MPYSFQGSRRQGFTIAIPVPYREACFQELHDRNVVFRPLLTDGSPHSPLQRPGGRRRHTVNVKTGIILAIRSSLTPRAHQTRKAISCERHNTEDAPESVCEALRCTEERAPAHPQTH